MLVYAPRFANRPPRKARNWCPNDREIRTFSHLSAISAEVGRVELVFDERVLGARLHAPLFDPLMVPIELESAARDLDAGSLVQLQYMWHGSSFSTVTRVEERLSSRQFLLRLPRDISSEQKRLFHRRSCHGRWKIVAKGLGHGGDDARLPILDISAAGVCVYVGRDQLSRIEDRMVTGLMSGPGPTPMPVRFKVTNLRKVIGVADPENPDPISLFSLAAGPFRGLGLRSHQTLARAIATLPVDAPVDVGTAG